MGGGVKDAQGEGVVGLRGILTYSTSWALILNRGRLHPSTPLDPIGRPTGRLAEELLSLLRCQTCHTRALAAAYPVEKNSQTVFSVRVSLPPVPSTIVQWAALNAASTG
jgi:hypothetical protein